jgi:hypothetical protein
MTLKGKKQDSEKEQDSDSSITTPEGSLSDLEVTPPAPKKAKKAPPKKKAATKAASVAATKKEKAAAKFSKLTKKG